MSNLCALRDQLESLGGRPDQVSAASATAYIAGRSHDAEDAALLLEMLGLTEAVPVAQTLLKLGRLQRGTRPEEHP